MAWEFFELAFGGIGAGSMTLEALNGNNRSLTKYDDSFNLTYTSAASEPSTGLLVACSALAMLLFRLPAFQQTRK